MPCKLPAPHSLPKVQRYEPWHLTSFRLPHSDPPRPWKEHWFLPSICHTTPHSTGPCQNHPFSGFSCPAFSPSVSSQLNKSRPPRAVTLLPEVILTEPDTGKQSQNEVSEPAHPPTLVGLSSSLALHSVGLSPICAAPQWTRPAHLENLTIHRPPCCTSHIAASHIAATEQECGVSRPLAHFKIHLTGPVGWAQLAPDSLAIERALISPSPLHDYALP
ncbi:hypothetical protein CORC01_07319 [Colletotrichum orchidophilum]|uniref:Uncharacterized protein n=1 Tax=Colletotrichum orchidophilum TaxID=1209926 RepID=A0A1G4B7P9_9PEZI|nr:uncharacterized protein CORC01_07319 [Colletotrichum orchidophilum]OHE97414.1 hypothetical protein CORC01_07319 [Colletotrichum orchidophilum]